MKQMEILVVRVRLRADDRHDAREGRMTWAAVPEQSKVEVVRDIARMLCAHLEQRAVVEASDD